MEAGCQGDDEPNRDEFGGRGKRLLVVDAFYLCEAAGDKSSLLSDLVNITVLLGSVDPFASNDICIWWARHQFPHRSAGEVALFLLFRFPPLIGEW